MNAQSFGLLVMGLFGYLVAHILFWNRARPVFWFTMALIVVGLGYLATTPTPAELVRDIIGSPAWLN